MSHSKPQRRVASRSASPAATMAMRSAIELGLATMTRSLIDLRQTVGRHARAGQLGPPADAERRAVAGRALAALGRPQLAALRRGEHAEHRHPVLDQSDRDAPAGPLAQEIAGAVDRIDHPEPPPLDPVRIVERLLGQPARLADRARSAARAARRRAPDRRRRPDGPAPSPTSCSRCRSGRRRSGRPPRRSRTTASSTGDHHPVDPQGRHVDRAAELEIVGGGEVRDTCRSDCRRW